VPPMYVTNSIEADRADDDASYQISLRGKAHFKRDIRVVSGDAKHLCRRMAARGDRAKKPVDQRGRGSCAEPVSGCGRKPVE
jgi:hypothetical protein